MRLVCYTFLNGSDIQGYFCTLKNELFNNCCTFKIQVGALVLQQKWLNFPINYQRYLHRNL